MNRLIMALALLASPVAAQTMPGTYAPNARVVIGGPFLPITSLGNTDALSASITESFTEFDPPALYTVAILAGGDNAGILNYTFSP